MREVTVRDIMAQQALADFRDQCVEEGERKGLEKGLISGAASESRRLKRLSKLIHTDELLHAIDDEAYKEKLYKKYHIE